MPRGEWIRVLVFVGAVVAVYVAAAAETLRIVRERLRWAAEPTKARRVWRRTLFGIAAFGLVCVAYGRFVEPYWPEVTHTRISTRKLPKGTRPIRLVHLSDIHSDSTPRLE